MQTNRLDGNMRPVELTPSQEKILRTLVNANKESEDTVKGETIAMEINRGTGTVRNQMQGLKSLNLVEGIPGPKGGYKPTAQAYEVLDIQDVEDPISVPVKHEGENQESMVIEDLTFSNVHHPDRCRAEVYVRNSIQGIDEGDELVVGPTPIAKLVVKGIVRGKDDTKNGLILKIRELVAPGNA